MIMSDTSLKFLFISFFSCAPLRFRFAVALLAPGDFIATEAQNNTENINNDSA